MPSTRRIPAKISRPRPDAVFEREGLFGRLDATADRPVTWIAGPAGAGKTLLAASYVPERACIWYQLDEGDADPATFFYYLGLAAQHATPRRRVQLPLFTPEYQAGTAAFARRFFEQLCERLPPGTVIVFDNYEQVPASALLHTILVHGLPELDAGMRAIVLSRHASPPAFARLRAAGSVAVVESDELRLRPAEADGIAALYERSTGRRLSEAVKRTLVQRSQGWAAGLVLLIEQARLEDAASPDADMEAPGLVFDYFAHELFQGVSESVQDFLVRTAIPSTFNEALAVRLTSFKRTRPLLQRLIRDNFFTNRLAGRVTQYRYHPLFRSFLLERARETLPGREYRHLQELAALARAEDGDYEEAVRLLRECGAWGPLTGLIRAHAEEVMNQGRFRTVMEWIEAVPADVRDAEPWLLFWLGSAQFYVDTDRCRDTMLRALEAFEREGDAAGAFLATAKGSESCFVDWNDFRPLDAWIESVNRLRAKYGDYPSPFVEWRVVATMAQAMIMRMPLHPDLRSWISRFSDLLTGSEAILQNLVTTYMEFSYFLMRGDLVGMHKVMDTLRPLAQQPAMPPIVRLFWLVNVAEEAFYRVDNRKSIATVEEGLALAQATGVHIRDNCFLDSGVKAAVAERDLTLAEHYLERMQPFVGSSAGFYTLRYHRNASQIAFYRGDLNEAERQIKLVLDFSESRGFAFHRIDCQIGHAMIVAGQGRWAEAQRTLRELARAGRTMSNPFLTFASGLGRAWLALRRERPGLATRILRSTLDLGRSQGMYYLEWWQPEGLSALVAHALENGIEPDYCRELIAKYRLVPPAGRASLQAWPWPVRILALGPPRVERDGAPLPLAGKAQQKPLELLKTLVALGGQDVSVAVLSELLWPDSDGDDAQRAFGVTLHRLRKLVGSDALVLRERRLSLDEQSCWVDAWAFKGHLSVATAALAEGAPERAGRALSAALALYRGAFLEDEEGPAPYYAERDALRARTLDTIVRVAEALLEAGDATRAIALMRRGVELDPLAESLYRDLMRAQVLLGQHGDAAATYRRCVDNLHQSGVTPAPETEALLRGIAT